MTPARVVAGLALVALACLTPAAPAQTFTWQNANGAWSTGTNWVGGTAPPAGGGSGVVLKFVADNTISTTNDLGNPFEANGLTFAAASYAFGPSVYLTSAAGNSVRLVANGATNPTIRLEGPGDVYFDSTLSLTAPTVLTGPGTGGITFNQAMAGPGVLTINTSPLTPGTGLVTLNGPNAIGGVTLTSGNLVIGNDAALGLGGLTVNGGTVRTARPFFGSTVTVANGVNLNADLVFAGTDDLTLTGVVSGSGGIFHSGSGTLTLTGANNYLGSTVVGGLVLPGEAGGGTLVLTGPNGVAGS